MRIALFSWESLYSIKIGGVGIHAFNIAASLAEIGHEVHIFTRQKAGQNFSDTISGVFIHRLPWDNSDNFLQEVKAFNNTLVYYFTEISSNAGKFDIIHCHDWLTFNAGLRLKNDAKIIATFHTTEWGRSGNWPESAQAKHISQIEKETVEKADHIIAVSYEVRRELELLYHAPDWKLEVIHYGVSLPEIYSDEKKQQQKQEKLHLPGNARIILFVGSLNQKKGLDILLNTTKEVISENNNAVYFIAGTGDMQGRVEGLTSEFPGRVLHYPQVSTSKMQNIYQCADIVAIPYRYDPFGIVTLTAWSFATPVISTGKGATAEIIYPDVNGIKSTENDLSSDLLPLLNKTEHLKWLGNNARITVETAFTWKKVAEKTYSIYKKAIKEQQKIKS